MVGSTPLFHSILDALEFSTLLGNRRTKSYPLCGVTITVDFKSETIIYPEEIKLGDRTTSNFQNSENFVVLECVNRLLTKGYPPSCIELEHKWSVGRKYRGKLDILVRHNTSNQSYLMIECKTHPEEYEKEKRRMQEKDGGQLFSYWLQDRNAEYLCLYTSYVSQGAVKYESAIVQIEPTFRSLGDVSEVFNRWNKQFAYKGLFESDFNPYGVGSAPLLRGELQPLKEPDGKRIYLQFLEILRHNVVSDKGNAFNKIFNLFLCKIVDEEKNEDQELDFQWVEGRDTKVSLLGRLNSLYKRGMGQYLNKDVTDYSVEDIGSDLLDDEAQRKITELRLYKNQEFAFTEVFNEGSFNQNATIVIEMVRLLERWQLRYAHKQQFLGDFFELLLNTGFKQESGQYFTPVPLVQFIVKSLPIEDIVHEKLSRGEHLFLPYTIDFACGSGHFLTETMDLLENMIQSMTTSGLNRTQERKLCGYQVDTLGWAEEYVYGVEFDYRLAKTSKLACFLNGDGEAKIIHASGIEPFDSEVYEGRLSSCGANGPQFDMLVANPPYSVDGFKATVNDGASSFSLFDRLGDKSDKIEVLFVERMTQLVKPGGVVGIILDLSLVTGGGQVYEATRRTLLENFEVRGIVRLGSGAFMATGIKTVVLFLRKRPEQVNLESEDDYRSICNKQSVVVVTSGERDAEKKFLGYEFSRRRGSEGIKIRRESLLLDKENPSSQKHVAGYILANMRNNQLPDIDPRLSEHVKICHMEDLFHWDINQFTNSFVFKKYQLSYPDASRLVSLRSAIDEIESGKRPKGGVSEIDSGAWSLGGEHINAAFCEISTDNMKYVPIDYFQNMQKGVVQPEDILVNKDGALTGKVALFLDAKNRNYVCVNEHLFRIRADENMVRQKYLFYYMVSDFFQQQVIVYAHQKKGQPGLNLTHIEWIRFLVIDKSEQDSVIRKIDERWNVLVGEGDRKDFVNKVFCDLGLKGESS